MTSAVRERLKKISAEILFSGDDFGRIYAACQELYNLFSEMTGIGDSLAEAPKDRTESWLANGKAISPVDAARCVLDIARTTRFLRSIYAAILELKNRFPGERIEILYAGCGPFAPLIVPLLDCFKPAEIGATLVDYHARSLEAAKIVFRKMEFEDFAADFVQADACRYKHNKQPHLIISETMQKALEKEPQAAVMLNLAPQLVENGVFIPQKISIEACLADSRREFALDRAPRRERINLGTILELDAEKIRRNAPKEFAKATLEIPPLKFENLSFMLLTKIVVFDSNVLDDYDSAITYPTILRDLNVRDAGGRRVEFLYLADEKPHFEYRLF